MEGIEAKLQIGTDIKNILYTMDKEFALTANYPKGWAQEFHYFMKTEYPGPNLVPVVRATGGTRQDLACEGAQALYMNRKYYTKFLDQILQAEDANILDRNMALHLKCLDIVASACVHGIVHISLTCFCHIDSYQASVISSSQVSLPCIYQRFLMKWKKP